MSNEQTQSRLFEGDFIGRPIKAEYGSGKNGRPGARIVMEIVEGSRSGTQVTYEANFKTESIKYTKRDLIAAGWQGRTMATLVEDVTRYAEKLAADGECIPFAVRIAEYTNPETGKYRQWNSVGSIGNVAPPLSAPTNDLTKNVDSWFAEVDGGSGSAGGGYGSSRHPNAPGNDDDLPF